MAGKVISRAYNEKIEEVGIFSILERVESGDTLQTIAKSLGMSRPFLSTALNRDRTTAEALCIARAIAATKRLAAHPEQGGQFSSDGPQPPRLGAETILAGTTHLRGLNVPPS